MFFLFMYVLQTYVKHRAVFYAVHWDLYFKRKGEGSLTPLGENGTHAWGVMGKASYSKRLKFVILSVSITSSKMGPSQRVANGNLA